MFNPHWLKVDVYAGPFLVKSLSEPYYVAKIIPVMSMADGRAAQKDHGLVASFESKGKPRIMGEPDYASMLPATTLIGSGTLDVNTLVIEREYTVDANSWSVRFQLVCDETSHIGFVVYDSGGNCVGYDASKGGIQNQFLATYSGTGSGNQDVDIPMAGGRIYRVKAVLEAAYSAGPFDVQIYALETPSRPAVLAAMPSGIATSTQPDNTVQFSITLGEAGHQHPLRGVTVTLRARNVII